MDVLAISGPGACCKDVQVMRGANCWTDHRMVRAKLRLGLQVPGRREERVLPFSVHELSSDASREEYRCLFDLPSSPPDPICARLWLLDASRSQNRSPSVGTKCSSL